MENQRKGCSGIMLLTTLPLTIVGVVFLVLGYLASPEALTDDGYPLKIFFYFMGASFLFSLLIPLIITAFLVLSSRTKQKKIEALIETGKMGQAIVLQLDDTGMRINDDPRVRLLLDVRIPGYPAYQVQKTMIVPMIRLPQVQPDSTVQILADPEQPDNPDRLALLLK